MSDIQTLAVFLDMSRNAVMTPTALKEFIVLAKKMGYNAVMLYMEDTYEVDGEPYFGYMRGGYTKKELKELDDFAYAEGIELIPAIQTLGHLRSLCRFRSKFPMDTESVLLVGSERTYELIDRMLSSLSECFRSRKINIGMDEANDIGRGKYLDLNGYESVVSIMKKHLDRVVELLRKYNYEPQMWADMFFRGWSGRYFNPKVEMPKEYCDALPEGVAPVYWDYDHWHKENFENMIYNTKQISEDMWFAGGVYTWVGFIPINDFSIISTRAALDACREGNVKNIIITTWGNDGGECSRFSPLPALHFAAQYARGNRDMDSIKEEFFKIFGVKFDDFMAIDLPNRIAYMEEGREKLPYSYDNRTNFTRNPSKYMFYMDPFLGFHDKSVLIGEGKKYVEYKKELERVAKNAGKYAYVFKTAAALSDVMSVKYELGAKTREAYGKGDKEELLRLAREEYAPLVRKIRKFTDCFRAQWMAENGPIGFEIQEARLGGLMERIRSCGKRLIDYSSGKLERIAELDIDPIDLVGKKKSIEFYLYNYMLGFSVQNEN